jgi:hypothetical protein
MKKAAFFCLLIFLVLHKGFAHQSMNGQGGAFGGSGAGRSFSGASVYDMNDSVKLAFDLYANLGHSLSQDLHGGEPLGPGGSFSNVYNSFLYMQSTGKTPSPFRTDERIAQSDFGYIPLWQGNSVSTRVRYRFLPNVWGTMTLDCNLDNLTENAQSVTNYVQLGALQIKWAPDFLKGFSGEIGRVNISGSYCPIFDQMPLENFNFDGLIFNYGCDVRQTHFFSWEAAAGQQFLGRTLWFNDSTGNQQILFEKLDKTRNLNHLFLRAQYGYKRIFGLKVIGGFQEAPADSTQTSIGNPNILDRPGNAIITKTYYLPKTTGWHIGTELVLNTKGVVQNATLAYGRGSVYLAGGSPDCVNRPSSKVGAVVDSWKYDEMIPNFSMEGSSALYGMYWLNWRWKKLTVDGGIAGTWRIPEKSSVTYAFDHTYYYLDSASIYREGGYKDTAALMAQDFKTVKCALRISYPLAKYLRVGARYDEIHFFTPDAHSNIPDIEPVSNDYTLLEPNGNNFEYVDKDPARWEREAVNTHIITPFVALEVANMLRIQASYAFAFYDSPILRQSVLARWHGNFSLSATLNYRFAKLPD